MLKTKTIFKFSFILTFFVSQSYSFAQTLNDHAWSIDSSKKVVPKCKDSSSDSDGDGWGWENKTTCYVGDTFNYRRYPTCVSSNSDPDGDGWGWENSETCVVSKESSDSSSPTTSNECIDTDGDGWGWDGNSSCKISSPTEFEPDITVATSVTSNQENSNEELLVVSSVPENTLATSTKIKIELETAGPLFIKYGLSENNLNTIGPVENQDYLVHIQSLQNLNPDTTYFYSLVSGNLESSGYSFKTASSTPVISPANSTTSNNQPINFSNEEGCPFSLLA